MRYINKIFAVLLIILLSPLLTGAANEPRDSGKVFTFVDIVRKEKPAVVNISTSQQGSGDGGSVFHHFKEFFGENRPAEPKTSSLGSGFFIRKDGVILTNYHVVEGYNEIIVRLSDGREFGAELIGKDHKTDLALLKVRDKGPFPVVSFGDSDKLEVGEWVIAIGNPFGLEQTVTVGIVSAKERIIGMGPYDDFIQTDASINPGNSGGPLFNIKGEVIAINSMVSPTGQGIGFSIPINLARKIVAHLEKEGKVTRGWLGVMIQEVKKEIRSSLGLKANEGALISEVVEDSPASRSGVKKGDIITEFDGKKINKVGDLPLIVSETQVDSVVLVRAYRDGIEKLFNIKVGKLEEDSDKSQSGKGR
ncbi:MAG: trypsin-like peptidase domain-containing protein [Nitrospirota bacterium]